MDYLASMYIDNEMNLDEKRRFVERVRADHAFCALTLSLLEQEKLLREPLVPAEPVLDKNWHPPLRRVVSRLLKPIAFAAAGFTVAMLLFLTHPDDHEALKGSKRFVLFEPAADRVELAGSFTGWQRLAMRRIGDTGYWELNLAIPSGEHRFVYILDGHRRMADPTLLASEKDDFGGENSILHMEERI